jgi:hypothetical protein
VPTAATARCCDATADVGDTANVVDVPMTTDGVTVWVPPPPPSPCASRAPSTCPGWPKGRDSAEECALVEAEAGAEAEKEAEAEEADAARENNAYAAAVEAEVVANDDVDAE